LIGGDVHILKHTLFAFARSHEYLDEGLKKR
jgi:hypothetical protein